LLNKKGHTTVGKKWGELVCKMTNIFSIFLFNFIPNPLLIKDTYARIFSNPRDMPNSPFPFTTEIEENMFTLLFGHSSKV